tara:strand:+ start:329 stop:664 length:336 start_codon:yes stop_codon:yes gene_type:complete
VLVPNCDKNIKHESSEAGQKISNKNIALKTDIEKGRIIYYANCVSYHNNNPKKLGSIGPKVYGATIDVLTQKIVSGKYPKNYIPKRKSKIMPIMPHLNKKILTLHAFINTS